ncbi:hypothetical protein ECZU43_32970 [Escherichia coli]|nr:hypothetical protein ECZU43_32970 [Escherichia coli]
MLILRGQVALAAILTIAAAIGWFGREGGFPDTQIVALFVLFMVAGTVASTIDIASDGFCVDQLTRTGYGWGNSVQVGGSYLGMMRRRVFMMLSAASGWPVAMLMMAVLIMALSLPLWRITEPTRTATIPHVPALGYALRRKQARLGLLLVLMLNSGMRFVLPLLAPLLLDHGLSMSALGALFSGGNIAAGIAGTLAGGLLMKYTSPGRALLTAYGVRDRAAGGGDDAHDGAGSSAAADSPVSGHCPVHFAGLRAGLSLRHADVAFIAFAGRCRLHPLSMY